MQFTCSSYLKQTVASHTTKFDKHVNLMTAKTIQHDTIKGRLCLWQWLRHWTALAKTQCSGERVILSAEVNEVFGRGRTQRGSHTIVLPGQAETQPLHVGKINGR